MDTEKSLYEPLPVTDVIRVKMEENLLPDTVRLCIGFRQTTVPSPGMANMY